MPASSPHPGSQPRSSSEKAQFTQIWMVPETWDLTEMAKGSQGAAGHPKPLTKEGLAAGGQMTAEEGRHAMPSKEEVWLSEAGEKPRESEEVEAVSAERHRQGHRFVPQRTPTSGASQPVLSIRNSWQLELHWHHSAHFTRKTEAQTEGACSRLHSRERERAGTQACAADSRVYLQPLLPQLLLPRRHGPPKL